MLQSNDDRWPHWDKSFRSDMKDEPLKDELPGSPETSTKTQRTSPDQVPVHYMKYISLGSELLAAVLVGTFFGWVANRLAGNRIPWAIAVGVVIGAIAGFLNMYRLVIEEEQRDESKKRASSK